MAKMTDATKLLAIGLLNLADDDGYFYACPKMVRNSLRPLDDDSSITTVSLRDLSDSGYLSIKEHPTHGDIGRIEAFASHQVINKPKPSKISELYLSGINTVSIPDSYRLEGKGTGKGKERNNTCPQADGGGLGSFWASYPKTGKERSSKAQVTAAWKKIKAGERPSAETLLNSLEAWKGCEQWLKDSGQFIPGTHLFIKNQLFDSPPSQSTRVGAGFSATSSTFKFDPSEPGIK